MTALRFGVLVEDATDGDALRVIIQRRLGLGVKVKAHSGKGCARLRAKAEPWLRQLALCGFERVILLHDLDRNPENNALRDIVKLTEELSSIVVPAGIVRLICIPVEEMEAWFWSDESVVKIVGRGTGTAHPSPHNIASPKEELMRLSRASNGTPRYSTIDNANLAKTLNFEICAGRCESFRQLVGFLDAATPGS